MRATLKRLVIAGGDGRHEAEVFGGDGQRRQQRQRLEAVHLGGLAGKSRIGSPTPAAGESAMNMKSSLAASRFFRDIQEMTEVIGAMYARWLDASRMQDESQMYIRMFRVSVCLAGAYRSFRTTELLYVIAPTAIEIGDIQSDRL
jgi:hypothetical protein